MPDLTLDCKVPINLQESKTPNFHGELQSLSYLSRGLFLLYGQTKKYEKIVLDRRASREGSKILFSFGSNPPGLEGIPQDLVACFFHWYAVSVCNYVWVVGSIGYQIGSIKITVDDYAKEVIPEVLTYRNKVAAHFAKVKPKKGESLLDRDASVIFPVGFSDAFEAASWTLGRTFEGVREESTIKPWKLTKVHENLIPRYWPEAASSPPPIEG